MVEKQWFGLWPSYDGWTMPKFWLKNQNLPNCHWFSADISTQTRLLRDLQLKDPNLDYPKSSMGCIK
jgi:hypothetical protein